MRSVPETLNKWQGGVLGPPGDDKIYCIPSDADTVLVIDPVNGDKITFLGDGVIPKNTKDKWQVMCHMADSLRWTHS